MADQSIATEGAQYQAPRLKPIELRPFNGEPREWIAFRDLFQALVGQNKQLTPVTKLHYLRASLTDAAARRVETIGLTNDNFAATFDYLVSVYDDKRLLVNSAMRDFMEARAVTRTSGTDLDRLTSEVTRVITALESLGQRSHHCDAYIIYIVVSKLDANTMREWEESLGSTQLLPTWTRLMKFLETRARSLRAYEFAKPQSAQGASKAQKGARTNHAAVGASPNSNQQSVWKSKHAMKHSKNCSLCSESHYIAACSTFRSKPLDARKAIVVEKQLFYNCLGSHRVAECTSAKRCQQCNEKHHTLIHDAFGRGPVTNSPATLTANTMSEQSTRFGAGQLRLADQTRDVAGNSASSNHAVSRSTSRREVLLTTASIRVESHTGHVVKERALLDTGSELSFISESLAQLLKLPRHRIDVPLVGIGGRSNGTTRGAVSFTVRPHFTSSYRCHVDVVTLPKLTADFANDTFCQMPGHIYEGCSSPIRIMQPLDVSMSSWERMYMASSLDRASDEDR